MLEGYICRILRHRSLTQEQGRALGTRETQGNYLQALYPLSDPVRQMPWVHGINTMVSAGRDAGPGTELGSLAWRQSHLVIHVLCISGVQVLASESPYSLCTAERMSVSPTWSS